MRPCNLSALKPCYPEPLEPGWPESLLLGQPGGRELGEQNHSDAIHFPTVKGGANFYDVLFEHRGKRPTVHGTAFVAPTAVVCGDVTIGPNSHVTFGAVLVAQGNPIVVGTQSIIGENAVIRATAQYPVRIGNYVRVGPNAALYGCTLGDEVFLATGVTIFQGARIGKQAEVRINGVVHVKSVLPEKATVPINWIAVGDPAVILAPNEHDKIWAIQKPLNFPMEAYGVERAPDGNVDMKEITRRLAESAAQHRSDKAL